MVELVNIAMLRIMLLLLFVLSWRVISVFLYFCEATVILV